MSALTRSAVVALALLVVSCSFAAETAISGRPQLAPGAATPQKIPPAKALLPSLIPGVSYEEFPFMDSSTSASTLTALIYARAAGLKGELRRAPDYGQFEMGVVLVFPLDYAPQETACFLRGPRPHVSGTHEAYVGLIAPRKTLIAGGLARAPEEKDYFTIPRRDIILEAREPSEDELKAAKEAGVEFDVRPIALDAFVFFNNTSNPVKSLTLDQIRDIYTGRIKNWKELGGKDALITAYTRDRNSGSQELMEKMVLKGEKGLPVKSIMVQTMGGPVEGVSNTEDAIAYSVYYYEHIMNPNRKNRLLAVNGVIPTPETIASRKYPLVAEVYVVTRKGMDPNSPAIKLRDWLLSDDGQRLVAESGYVPIRRVKPR